MILIPVVILSLESERDREFMSNLYMKYRALMYKVVWVSMGYSEDADDIISDSLVAMIKNIETLKKLSDNEKRSYIVKTVRSKGINSWKKAKEYRQYFQSTGKEEMESLSDNSKGIGTISFFEELDAVNRAIDALPENEKRVIRMKFLEDKSDKEIAEQIGIAESSIRKYLQRAKKHIKDTVYRNEAET